MSPKLTYERAHLLLSYDPETGIFRWKLSRGGQLAGSEAGHVQVVGPTKRLYRMIRIDRILYAAQNVAWLMITGNTPKYIVDHKDTDSLNNRFNNLREATTSENCRNQNIRVDNTSGFKGVSFDKARNLWGARIGRSNKKYVYLGRFKTAEQAAEAYKRAADAMYQEFARY